MVDLTTVVPVFNEEQGIDQLYARLSASLNATGLTYEIIFVDDGSRDRSPVLLEELADADARVTVVHLSRNFGHQAALAAGLAHSAGTGVVVIDADLQDPPEVIPELIQRWRDGYDIVYGQRIARKGERTTKRALAWLYYRLVRSLADIDLPTDTGDFCLMDRSVVDALNALPERNRYVRGLRAWVGFRQTAVPYVRAERQAGAAKYGFRQSLGLGLNGIFSLSRAPLRLATWLGVIVSASSLGLAVWFVVRKITVGYEVRGWASTVVLILFLGGIQLLTIGLVGEYVGRIYDEVKRRPLYIVSRISGGRR